MRIFRNKFAPKRFYIIAKKIVLVFFLVTATGLFSQENIDATAFSEFEWYPRAAVVNKNSALNPDNYLERQNLVNQATASFWFDVYYKSLIQLSGNFELQVDTSRSQVLMSEASQGRDYSTLGDFSLGFDQLYMEGTIGSRFYLGYGKYPVRYGYSKIVSPLNYAARGIDFQDTLAQWNGWLKGNLDKVNFSINYFPSISFKDNPNNMTEVETFFSGFETDLDRQTLALNLSGFFFDSLDLGLNFYMQDKGSYDFEEFYIAAGGGFSWSILDKFIWRSEGIYGNGYDDIKVVTDSSLAHNPITATYPQSDLVYRDLDLFYPKVLTGFTAVIPGDIEFSMEYYYNGSGMTATEREEFLDALDESGKYYNSTDSTYPDRDIAHQSFLADGIYNWKVYELGQHYLFVQLLKLGVFQRVDIINSSMLLLDDFSYINVTDMTYFFSDNFSLGGGITFFLFKEGGAYSLTPEQATFEIGLKYSS